MPKKEETTFEVSLSKEGVTRIKDLISFCKNFINAAEKNKTFDLKKVLKKSIMKIFHDCVKAKKVK